MQLAADSLRQFRKRPVSLDAVMGDDLAASIEDLQHPPAVMLNDLSSATLKVAKKHLNCGQLTAFLAGLVRNQIMTREDAYTEAVNCEITQEQLMNEIKKNDQNARQRYSSAKRKLVSVLKKITHRFLLVTIVAVVAGAVFAGIKPILEQHSYSKQCLFKTLPEVIPFTTPAIQFASKQSVLPLQDGDEMLDGSGIMLLPTSPSR